MRLASLAGANATWDNLRVTDSFSDAVPETSSAALAMLGLSALARRRRK